MQTLQINWREAITVQTSQWDGLISLLSSDLYSGPFYLCPAADAEESVETPFGMVHVCGFGSGGQCLGSLWDHPAVREFRKFARSVDFARYYVLDSGEFTDRRPDWWFEEDESGPDAKWKDDDDAPRGYWNAPEDYYEVEYSDVMSSWLGSELAATIL